MFRAAIAGSDDDGPCTAIGHTRHPERGGAPLAGERKLRHTARISTTPSRAGRFTPGAVVVPAVAGGVRAAQILMGAAAPQRDCDRRGGALPPQPRGAEGRAQGRLPIRRPCSARWERRRASRAALGLDRKQNRFDALGIAGSMASGIIEYLAERRLDQSACTPAGAAQSGLAAPALIGARRGVFPVRAPCFEGTHGLFHGFAHNGGRKTTTRCSAILGRAWVNRDARLQALSVRDDDASLHRLRAAAGGARREGRGRA